MGVVSAFPCQSRFFSPPFRKDLKNAATVFEQLFRTSHFLCHVDDGANGFALTTDSAALSTGS